MIIITKKSATSALGLGYIFPETYGGKGDGKTVQDAAVSGTALTSASAAFLPTDVGKYVILKDVTAATAADFITTIAAYTSPTAVTLTSPSPVAITGRQMSFGTDNTAAIQQCITLAGSRKQGTVYCADGLWLLAGPLVTVGVNSTNPNSQLVFPYRTSVDGEASIRIMGGTPPGMSDTALANIPLSLSTCGAIFYSLADGSGTRPAIFGGVGPADPYGSFTYVRATFRNLTVRTRGNRVSGGSMCGIHAGWLANTGFQEVVADLDLPSLQSGRPATETVGIVNLYSDGGTDCDTTGIRVSGYRIGLIVGEHATGDRMQLFMCETGLAITASGHGLRFSRMIVQWCKYAVAYLNQTVPNNYPGNHGAAVVITELCVERLATGHWWDFAASISDPANLLTMDVSVVNRVSGLDTSNGGAMAPNPGYVKVGGSLINDRIVGAITAATSAPAPNSNTFPTKAGGLGGTATTGTMAAFAAGTPILYASNTAVIYSAVNGQQWYTDTDTAKAVYEMGDGRFSAGVGSSVDTVAPTLSFVPVKRFANIIMPTGANATSSVVVKFGPNIIGSFSQVSAGTHAAAVVFTADCGAAFASSGYSVRLVNAGSTVENMYFSAATFYDTLAAAQADGGIVSTAPTNSASASRVYGPAGNTWTADTNAIYSTGTGEYGDKLGDYYTDSFTGTSVQISTPLAPNAAYMDVFIDGSNTAAARVYAYASATTASQVLVPVSGSLSGFTSGNHTIKVVIAAIGGGVSTNNVGFSDKIQGFA